jgi:hypothetical protein
MYHFPASYVGRCTNCNEILNPGDEVYYDGSDSLTGWDCCGATDEARNTPETSTIERVMPRGRTAKDRCGTCFQIPSTNGVCGCD